MALSNYNDKLKHIYMLVQLANIESVSSEIEWVFIQKVAQAIDVNIDDLNDFDPDKITQKIPKSEYEVIPLFHRLLLLMGIDQRVSDEERRFCFEMGIKMGLHPQAIDELIRMVRDSNSPIVLKPKVVMEIFNKYYN